MLHISRLGTFFVLAATILLTGCSTTRSASIPLSHTPAPLSAPQIRTAILKGMSHRGWKELASKKQEDSIIHACILGNARRSMYGSSRGTLMGYVDISYTTNTVSLSSLSPDGKKISYDWFEYLKRDIAKEIARAQMLAATSENKP